MLSVPYLSGLLLLLINTNACGLADFKPFSPLFIGIIIVTLMPLMAVYVPSFLSVPYLSGLLLLLRLNPWIWGYFITLSVPYLSGLLLLPVLAPTHKQYVVSFSPLFIGIIIVTRMLFFLYSIRFSFQSPIYRDYYCYIWQFVDGVNINELSVPYLSGLLLLRLNS